MQNIPLQVLANQSFTIVLDNNEWRISLKTTNGCLSVSFILNNEIVIENTRAVANQKIIPSKYEEAGNFVFLTQNFNLPEYTQFGITQILVYISAAELAVYRDDIVLPITAADFNSIAALPLRFAPQGYNITSPLGYPFLQLWNSPVSTPLGAIASYPDLSGNGNTAIELTIAEQPVNTANSIGTQNGLIYPNSSFSLSAFPSSSINNLFATGGCVIAVIKPTGANGIIFSKTRPQFITLPFSSGTAALRFTQLFVGTNGQWATTNRPVNINVPNLVAITYDKSSASNVPTIYANSLTPETLTEILTPSGVAANDSGDNLVLGGFEGALGDIEMRNVIPSTIEFATLMNYYANKFGITLV